MTACVRAGAAGAFADRRTGREDETSATAKEATQRPADVYKWRAFAAIAVGLLTSVADNGSVLMALPTISRHFGTDLPTTQWVFLASALTVSALLLPMGRLSDMVGRKRLYVIGYAAFAAGAVLASASSSILLLICARVIMGTGAAMTQGTSMAIIVATFPHEERGKALGLQMSVVGTGNVAGPAIGGFIIGALGWRGVFYSTAILGIASTLVAQAILREEPRDKAEPRLAFDWFGAGLSAAAMVVFLLAMTNAPKVGWSSPAVVAGFVAVAGMVGAFVWWELRTASPVMDVRLFSRRQFSVGAVASFLSFLGMSSQRFLMPFFLQAVRGLSPSRVGLLIVPSALAMIVAGPLGGRLSDRYGSRPFTVGGLAVGAMGLFMLSRLTEVSPVWTAVLGMVLVTGGEATFIAPNNSAVLSAVERSRYGVASGFLNQVRNTANVTGIALATAIITAIMGARGAPPTLAAVSQTGAAVVLSSFTAGVEIVFTLIGVLVIVGAVLSLFQRAPSKGSSPAD